MSFPSERPRRLRANPALRRLARETEIGPQDLVYPLFVREDIAQPQAIAAMPGHQQHTLESLTREVEAALTLNVQSFLLFGIPSLKDGEGSLSWSQNYQACVTEPVIERSLGRGGLGMTVFKALCEFEHQTVIAIWPG